MATRPCVVLLVTTLLAVACGDDRSDVQKYADAVGNIEAERYREAVIDLKNLMRNAPNDTQSRVALARAHLGAGDWPAAHKEASRARELGATPDQFAEPLARSMLASNRFVELLAEIDDSDVSDPAVASVLRALRGRAMFALGSVNDADTIFDELIAADQSPEAVHIALLGKVDVTKRQTDLESAEAFARRALELFPDSSESVLAVGELLMRQKKYKQAEEMFRRQTLKKISVLHTLLMSAGIVDALLGQDRIDEATIALEKLQGTRYAHPVIGYLKGKVAFRGGNVDGAFGELQAVLAVYPNYRPAQMLFGVVAMERGDLEPAEMRLSSVVANNPGDSEARSMLAQVRLAMHRPRDAAETLEDGLLNDAQNPDLLAMLGQTRAAQGNMDEAIRYLEQSYSANPIASSAKALASAYSATGQFDKALAVIESLPTDDLNIGLKETLGMLTQFDRDKPGESLAAVDNLIARYNKDPSTIGFAASIYLHANENIKARELFERVLELDPTNHGAILSLSHLDQIEGGYDSSQAHFEAYLATNPNDLSSLLGLARIAGWRGDNERAMAFVEQANEAHPKALIPNLSLSITALQSGDLVTARRHAQAAVEGNPKSAAAHSALGLYHLAANETGMARARLHRAVRLRPDSHVYLTYLARAQIESGRVQGARTNLVRALKLQPQYFPAARELTMLDIGTGNIAEAANRVARLAARHDGRPGYLELKGDVLVAQGGIGDALAVYQTAAEMRPSRELALKRYTVMNRTNMPDAASVLRSWLELSPDDVSMRLLVAIDDQRSGSHASAIQNYTRVLQVQAGNTLALNNLAWLYFLSEDFEARARALQLARRAHELVPENRDFADTYGWILVNSGQLDEGVRILESALSASDPTSDPDLAYHLAEALTETGEHDRAKVLLRAALVSEQPFHERSNAKALHDRL